MEITIIIVNWNTREMLRNCLQSIVDSNAKDNLKIVVVDNDSKDGSREMVLNEYQDAILINSGCNLGFGKANNLGKDHVVGDYVLYLNPDTIVLDGTLQKMKQFMSDNPDVGALGCKMIYPDGNVQPLGLQWFPNPLTELINLLFVTSSTISNLNSYLPYQDPNNSAYVNKLYGGCLLVRKSVLDRVGWFDERFFMSGEDVDLCRRIVDAGWKLYYMSDAVIIHLCGGASSKSTSDFSTLMMCDSISKLIGKYDGVIGYILYRLAIFAGSNVRLLILLIVKICRLNIQDSLTADYENSINKYKAMLKWSLNLQRPTIPA